MSQAKTPNNLPALIGPEGSTPRSRRRRVVRSPAISRGAALSRLWEAAQTRPGIRRVYSRAALAKEWGVAQSSVTAWLDGWAAAGIITKSRLEGNQGTEIAFLRPPTSDDIDVVGSEEKTATGNPSRSSAGSSVTSSPTTLSKSKKPRLGNALRSSATTPTRNIIPFPQSPSPTSSPTTLPTTSQVVTDVVADDLEGGRGGVGEVVGDHLADHPVTVAPTTPEPVADHLPTTSPQPRVRLSLFRATNALRLISAAAVATSVAMIAYHSATSSAATPFHWYATLAMAVILSSGKVVLGTVAESFGADGERCPAIVCALGALFLLSVDASLLYAFRGDSLSNAAAMEQAAMESRARIKTRLDGLIAEQQRLAAVTATPEDRDVRLVAEVEADLHALTTAGDCRLFTPKRSKRNPKPEPTPVNPRKCETKRSELQGELARAQDAEKDEARALASTERREKRLAELPGLIRAAETELAQTQARATPDHGASIVARGLNWVPAGVTDLVWGVEARPVAGRGVEIFWSWAFVLAAEMFAVGGFAIAARADRRARRKLCQGG